MQRLNLVRPCRAVVRHSIAAVSALLLSACATAPSDPAAHTLWPAHADDAQEAAGCRKLLAAERGDEDGLNAADIRLLNWNVQKGKHPAAHADLDSHGDGSDLILLQEASLRRDFLLPLGDAHYWSFAPGYVTDDGTTGVLTRSATMPLARCSLVSYEPWLRSPKATSITQFALSDSRETLVVVNMHAINFTLGTRRFAEQFEQIGIALAGHRGPVILSGDFNTWRPGRQNVVDELAASLDLRPVRFGADRRKRVFGQFLDHVYTRGLQPVESSTAAVSTSDHNPMLVRFAREPQIVR